MMAGLLQAEALQHTIIAVAANKQDLPSALSVHALQARLRAESGLTSEAWARVAVFPTSALTGDNVTEPMEWILRSLSSAAREAPRQRKDSRSATPTAGSDHAGKMSPGVARGGAAASAGAAATSSGWRPQARANS